MPSWLMATAIVSWQGLSATQHSRGKALRETAEVLGVIQTSLPELAQNQAPGPLADGFPSRAARCEAPPPPIISSAAGAASSSAGAVAAVVC
ncbi:hypothetical protein COO60DRAFT_449162 [Scenedesmus sp. NREL 46B-D3]|nr:hypothetical protein COO60DRAFT_449162 [Scenedesmus sp. NREL 46B-D3]